MQLCFSCGTVPAEYADGLCASCNLIARKASGQPVFRALCSFCGEVRTLTLQKRDVPLSGGGVVEDLVVGVCDVCERAVSIPQSSVPQVAEAIRKRRSSPP